MSGATLGEWSWVLLESGLNMPCDQAMKQSQPRLQFLPLGFCLEFLPLSSLVDCDVEV